MIILLIKEINLTWDDKKRLALETCRALTYLHAFDPPILHRDLKSLNLLVDEFYRIKLADFGWTKILDNYMTGKIGTYQWMAPEVIQMFNYTEKADVYSFGIILWEISAREPPFRSIHSYSYIYILLLLLLLIILLLFLFYYHYFIRYQW